VVVAISIAGIIALEVRFALVVVVAESAEVHVGNLLVDSLCAQSHVGVMCLD
jgi:hypothetical protein